MTPQEMHKKEANLPRGQRMLLGQIRLHTGWVCDTDDILQARALMRKGFVKLEKIEGTKTWKAVYVEPAKLPVINYEEDSDMDKRSFNKVRDYLLANYTPLQLAGALINAMSGHTFDELHKKAVKK